MKKLLTILLLLIAFTGYGQQFNITTHKEVRTDSLNSYGPGSIAVKKKMFFTITPTMTADGDVVYLGYLNNRLDTLASKNSVSLELQDSLGNYLLLSKYELDSAAVIDSLNNYTLFVKHQSDSTTVSDTLAQHRTDINTKLNSSQVAIQQNDSLNNYWRGDRDNIVTGANRILIGANESVQLTDGSYGHILLARNSGDTTIVEIASSDGTGSQGGIYIFPNQGISILDTTMHYSADFLAEQNDLDLLHTAAVRRLVNDFMDDSVHAKLDTANLIATKSDLSGVGGVSEAYVASSIDSVDQATEISYTATTTTDWPGTDPNDVGEALDSLASRTILLEGLIKIDTVNMGSWDMDATQSINISNPYSFGTLLYVVPVFINDAGTDKGFGLTYNDLSGGNQAGISGLSGSTIQVFRVTGGQYDNTNFDDTGINRGYLVFFHL